VPRSAREWERTARRCRREGGPQSGAVPGGGSRIETADLGLSASRAAAPSLEEMSLESVESILIRKALARTAGNVSQAADALGLSRGALYRRMEKYGIQANHPD
jgi:transcriptional regulator of acetoin/glycerol metabolism